MATGYLDTDMKGNVPDVSREGEANNLLTAETIAPFNETKVVAMELAIYVCTNLGSPDGGVMKQAQIVYEWLISQD